MLEATSIADRDCLYELMTREILPAVKDQQFDRFAHAVTQFNYRSGMLFASSQGGAYNGRELESLIGIIRELGCDAVGQSSWGPSVFAICESADQAGQLSNSLTDRLGRDIRLEFTRARNKSATITSRSRSDEAMFQKERLTAKSTS